MKSNMFFICMSNLLYYYVIQVIIRVFNIGETFKNMSFTLFNYVIVTMSMGVAMGWV